MAEINKYLFVDAVNKKTWVIPDKFSGKLCLVGKVKRDGFPDNSLVITSSVTSLSLENNTAITASGTEYILHELSEDYKDFVNATEKGIAIIRNWKLEGNKKEGYSISGTTENGNIKGKVVAQRKNFITLNDGISYFVMWNDSAECNYNIRHFGTYLDLDAEKDFEDFIGLNCRPRLFNK